MKLERLKQILQESECAGSEGDAILLAVQFAIERGNSWHDWYSCISTTRQTWADLQDVEYSSWVVQELDELASDTDTEY